MREIIAASGVGYNSATYTLKSRPDLFESTPAGRYRGCTLYAWSLKDADAGRADPVRRGNGRGAAAMGRGKGR